MCQCVSKQYQLVKQQGCDGLGIRSFDSIYEPNLRALRTLFRCKELHQEQNWEALDLEVQVVIVCGCSWLQNEQSQSMIHHQDSSLFWLGLAVGTPLSVQFQRNKAGKGNNMQDKSIRFEVHNSNHSISHLFNILTREHSSFTQPNENMFTIITIITLLYMCI